MPPTVYRCTCYLPACDLVPGAYTITHDVCVCVCACVIVVFVEIMVCKFVCNSVRQAVRCCLRRFTDLEPHLHPCLRGMHTQQHPRAIAVTTPERMSTFWHQRPPNTFLQVSACSTRSLASSGNGRLAATYYDT